MKVRYYMLLGWASLTVGIAHAHAQDARSISEPVPPTTCATLQAPLHATRHGPKLGTTAAEQNAESASETAILTEALKKCPSGQAVELSLGMRVADDAFLINPVMLPQGVSLIIDGGVTVDASRDPANFQDPTTPTIACGTVGDYPVNKGCKPLLTLAANSGLYGHGVLDGQGDQTLLSGDNAGTASWWTLLTQKKDCNKPDASASSVSASAAGGCEEASPLMVSTGNVTDGSSSNAELTLYMITIRNPPFHTVDLGGTDVTVWGVKVQAPWNVPNTDGFDVHGTNITIKDTIVANGDQEIAITSSDKPTSHITVERFSGYNKGGIALLGDGVGITNVLVHKAHITGDLPSVDGTTVNGVPEAVLKTGKYHLQTYGQALPNATNDLQGLQINSNLNSSTESKNAGVFSDITFRSICIQDIGRPIHVGPIVAFTPPQSPDEIPQISGVTFQDLHVLAPSAQFPKLDAGIPTKGSRGAYAVVFQAYPEGGYYNHFTLDNVVFDDNADGSSPLADLTAIGNVITTQTNVYPAIFNQLGAPYVADPKRKDGLTLSANSYAAMTSVSSPEKAKHCAADALPFVTGELYASTDGGSNGVSATVQAAHGVTLNAVVQPTMSQTTQFMPDSYGADPGLIAIGSPALTNPVLFYEGSKPVGYGKLAANGTLATLRIEKIKPGPHTYTAVYPADQFYKDYAFGSVTIQAQ
jgi:polygalacturonase